MKKVFKILKRIFFGIVLITYFAAAILVSTLVLNRNEFGVTQFNDKLLILVDANIENQNYPAGSLVIVRQKPVDKLKPGEEIFVYEKNDDDTVKIVIANVEEVNTDDKGYYYVTLQNNGGMWSEKYVAGVSESVYDDLGGYLLFIESKWMFFMLLIVPGFFILLYEIYLIIITIKYDDLDDDEPVVKQVKVVPETPTKEIVKAEPVETPKVNILPSPVINEAPDVQVQYYIPNQNTNNNDVPLNQLKPNEGSVIELPKTNVVSVERTTFVKEEFKPEEIVSNAQNYTTKHENNAPLAAPGIPQPPKEENSNDVEKRLESLLAEVSKLRDELNKK